jgi:16S rRNA (cytidine1402-2'-O)-methyltransferase
MSEIKKPALLLLPNLLGRGVSHKDYLPESVDRAVQSLDGLIAESEKGGRLYLSYFELDRKPTEVPIALLNEHTPPADYDFLLEPIMKDGERWGVLSDAGLPCLADPGAGLVRRARVGGIQIETFVGPSSILMALLLSGLPGQQFSFLGYLPKQPEQRKTRMTRLEDEAYQDNMTQIFIEAPYRNQHTLDTALETLKDETMLSIACDLTLPTEEVITKPVKLWKRAPLPDLTKRPVVFLVAAGSRQRAQKHSQPVQQPRRRFGS